MAKPKDPEPHFFSRDPRQQALFAATPRPPAIAPPVTPEEAARPARSPGRRAEPMRTASPAPEQWTIDDMIQRRASA